MRDCDVGHELHLYRYLGNLARGHDYHDAPCAVNWHEDVAFRVELDAVWASFRISDDVGEREILVDIQKDTAVGDGKILEQVILQDLAPEVLGDKKSLFSKVDGDAICVPEPIQQLSNPCLLYTSDAADEL